MSRQDEIELGRQAQQVLKNPAYLKAWELYEAKLWEQFKSSNSVEFMQNLRRQQSSLTIVKRNLEALIAGGIEAQAKIDFEQPKRSVMDRMLRRA